MRAEPESPRSWGAEDAIRLLLPPALFGLVVLGLALPWELSDPWSRGGWTTEGGRAIGFLLFCAAWLYVIDHAEPRAHPWFLAGTFILGVSAAGIAVGFLATTVGRCDPSLADGCRRTHPGVGLAVTALAGALLAAHAPFRAWRGYRHRTPQHATRAIGH